MQKHLAWQDRNDILNPLPLFSNLFSVMSCSVSLPEFLLATQVPWMKYPVVELGPSMDFRQCYMCSVVGAAKHDGSP